MREPYYPNSNYKYKPIDVEKAHKRWKERVPEKSERILIFHSALASAVPVKDWPLTRDALGELLEREGRELG